MKNAAQINDLITGNRLFKKDVYPSKKQLFDQLAGGQSPHVTMLTCSDSRIDPCAITQTEPGDLFVIRNAGNIAPVKSGAASGEIATLEFAVRALGTQHIVVCGHSDCGAMKGLLAPEKCAHLTYVSAWVRESEAVLATLDLDGLNESERLAKVIDANVLYQIENLMKLDFIAEAVEEGKLGLHGWVYNIGSGDINVLSSANETQKTATYVSA